MVHLHEIETDLSIDDNDPVSFLQDVSCDNFEKWLVAMKEKLNFMEHNWCNSIPQGHWVEDCN